MKNKIILLASFLTVVFLLASCLKDKVGDYWVDAVAGKMYATVPAYTLQSLALQPVAGDVPFSFALNIATDALPTEDITLTLAVDTASVTQFNQINIDWNKANPKATPKTIYKKFPSVQVLTTTIVIAKGTRTGTCNAKVWGAETLNACDNFMTAISIMSAKTASGKDVTIAGNMKSYLVALPISNPYAGDYHAIGYRLHPAPATYTVDKTETLSTIDCQTVRKSLMADYPYTCDIQITSATMVVGGVTVFKVIISSPDVDPANFGMYDTFTGDSSVPPPPPTPDVNYYNPVTKTFVLNYYYLSSGAARKIYEILTRL